jgi:hypothetical protein
MQTDIDEYASMRSHRLVVNKYGTDAVLRHAPSGIDIHLRSQFLGGLTEAFINERVGNCNLPLEAILGFFSMTSFVPGTVRHECQMTFMEWIYFALISDLLDLPHCVPIARDIHLGPPSASSHTLEYVLANAHHHRRRHVIDDVVQYICSFIGQAVDDDDTRKCFPIIKRAYGENVDLLANCFFLLGMGIHTFVLGKSKLPMHTTSDLTALRIIGSNYLEPFVSIIESFQRRGKPSLVECVSAFICDLRTDYADLPFTIKASSWCKGAIELTAKTLASESISLIFGLHLGVGDVLVVPFDRRNINLIQAMAVVSVKNQTVLLRPLENTDFSLDNGDLLRVHGGPHAGIHRVSLVMPQRTFEEYEHACIFGLDLFEDPFTASVNFVIKIGDNGDSWRVHDWVLHERWPFFRRVVDAGFAEARDRTIVLPGDFPESLLYAMISWIYTSTFLTGHVSRKQLKGIFGRMVNCTVSSRRTMKEGSWPSTDGLDL